MSEQPNTDTDPLNKSESSLSYPKTKPTPILNNEVLSFPPSQHRYTEEKPIKNEQTSNLIISDSPMFINTHSPAPINGSLAETSVSTYLYGSSNSSSFPSLPNLTLTNNSKYFENSMQRNPMVSNSNSPPPLIINHGIHKELPSLSNILNSDTTLFQNKIPMQPSNIGQNLASMATSSVVLPVLNDTAQQRADSLETPLRKPTVKKGSYSRNGCQACKARRQKCSEEKPVCWNCERLGRECVYVLNVKNKKRKGKVEKKDKKIKTEGTTKATHEALKNDNSVKEHLEDVGVDRVAEEQTNGKENLDDTKPFSDTHLKLDALLENDGKNILDSFDDLDSSDVNLLLQNLNDIVSMKLNDSNITLDEFEIPGLEFFKFNPTTDIPKEKSVSKVVKSETPNNVAKLDVRLKEKIAHTTVNNSLLLNSSVTSPTLNLSEKSPFLPMSSLSSSHSNASPISLNASRCQSEVSSHTPIHTPTVPVSVLVDSPITFNTPLDSFSLGGKHDDYLKIFYYDCMDSIAPFSQDQINPLRDTLLFFANEEPYLLSAILAVGASISFRKSKSADDEKFYCQYLTHCLNLLSEQFKEESNLLKKIEPIILTVIMLAWDCVYTMNSQWRSHLKGVTKLFQKINSSSSKVLNLAKCWFKVMETFANISTVLGGALLEDEDLDAIFDPYNEPYIESLKFLNVITQINDFNLIRGHKEDFDLVIKEVIKMLNSIRNSEKNYFNHMGIFNKDLDYLLWSPSSNGVELSYFKIQKILSNIDKQLDYQFIDKSGVIPIENPQHPHNSGVMDNAIDMVKLKNTNELIAISWYDISHQTQVLSFLLIVLLKLLGIPKESIMIQQVVEKITSFFKFLDSEAPPKNLRTCYCNFAILMAGLNAQDEKTRDVVRKYYEVNGDRFQRLTEHNLNRLEKVWYGAKKSNGTYNLEEQDVLTW